MSASGTGYLLEVLLVDEKPFWLAGDWLEGLVVLELFDRQSVRRVRLALSGEESTSWRESYLKFDEVQRVVIVGHVLREHQLLVTTGPSSSGLTLAGYPLNISSTSETAADARAAATRQSSIMMKAGLYVWPFRIGIPVGIQVATLVNETYGHISFRLKVFIDTVWKPGIDCVKKLHVVPCEPLYSSPDLIVPVSKATRSA